MKTKESNLLRDTAKAATAGLLAGYVTSPVVTEFYLHRSLAHNTYTLNRPARALSWLTCRAMGFSPSTWAIRHRLHHTPMDSQEPTKPVTALKTAVASGIGSLKLAEKALGDPAVLPHIQYPGGPPDPVIDSSTPAPKVRFQNKADAWLSRHPIAEKLVPLAAIGAVAVARKISGRQGAVTSGLEAAGFVAGLGVGTFGPAVIAASYPERRDGYTNAAEAGRDMGPVGQVVYGSFALHAAHHAAPHLSEPPGVHPLNRDLIYGAALELVGAGTAHDGQPA